MKSIEIVHTLNLTDANGARESISDTQPWLCPTC